MLGAGMVKPGTAKESQKKKKIGFEKVRKEKQS